MFHPFRFARIAIEAETLRFRYFVRRLIVRLGMAVVALVLVIAALVCGHAAAWYWLSSALAPPFAALILTGADVFLALVLLLIAARSSPSRVEREARDVRQQVMRNALQTATLSTAAARLGGRIMRARARG